ncbi:MAG: thiosulfate oxidation carrier complex protein SoxZ [Candidatus Eremiobacteraeota bacterium]|nr:thiosulfate oxidation carrier complex protein SoxZ [Candidatus Eremiobacteraeota bacterium]
MGEIIQIKTLAAHPMVSGQAKDKNGKTIPRDIINTFVCTYNGKQVFKMALEPAVSANPFIAFPLRVEQSGTLEFTWTDDNGAVYKDSAQITVT